MTLQFTHSSNGLPSLDFLWVGHQRITEFSELFHEFGQLIINGLNLAVEVIDLIVNILLVMQVLSDDLGDEDKLGGVALCSVTSVESVHHVGHLTCLLFVTHLSLRFADTCEGLRDDRN